MFEVWYGFDALVRLFVLIKVCSVVGSESGQPAEVPLTRNPDLIIPILLSRSGEESLSLLHGRLRLGLPLPSSKLMFLSKVDCEECGVVLVLIQGSSLVVKVTSSIDIRSS
jgi:hypothetical protein